MKPIPKDTAQQIPVNEPYIVASARDDGDLELGDIIDCQMFQSLMDDFYKLTGIPVGILDIKGKVLVAKGWQDICVNFHRIHPETCKNCLESDFELTAGILPGEFKQYKCKNNMWDIATPILIGGKRLGHIFLGQLMFEGENTDYSFFKSQAKRYGFDEQEYLAALDRVPRFSHEVVQTAMNFYSKLANILSMLSLSNIQLNRSLSELENAMSFQRVLMDAVPSPIFYKNEARMYIGGNKAFEDYIGMKQDQFIGKTAYDIAPAELAAVYDQSDRALLDNQGIQSYEASVLYADGTRHDVVFNKAVFTNAEGQVAGLIGVILDISERKQAEETLRVGHTQLELKVEERTSELMALNQELMAMNDELVSTLDRLKKTQQQLLHSEKMAALGRLVAGMSHEISTPIGIAVTGVSYVQLELKQINKKLRDGTLRKAEFEEFIAEAALFIHKTVANLERADLLIRSFKQISVDQTHESKRRFNVKAYLEELILSLDPLLRNKPHQVILICPDNLEMISCPGEFAQMITNFITNSIKHGFEAEFSGIMRIQVDKFGDFYTLTYSDNGKGMTQDVLEHIYDPFFTTKRGAEGGTGLGLHLVYNIVTQKLGGEIKCFSEPGKGSEFIITLPDIYGE